MTTIVNHLTFTPEQFRRASKIIKRDERAVYFNMEQGTLWIARSLREYMMIKVLRDPEEITEILKHFCPMFRELEKTGR